MCLFRVEFIDLAIKHKPLNLGQGFPDFAPPSHVTASLADVAKGDNVLLQQYTRGYVMLTIFFIKHQLANFPVCSRGIPV